MKKVVLTIVFAFLTQIGMAQDEVYKKDIMRLVAMSSSVEQIKLAKEQVVKMIPEAKQAAFIIEFDAALPPLYDNIAKVYMETYTKEEVKEIIKFYDSPIGKKVIEKSGGLAEKSQTALQDWATGLQPMMMKYMQ